MVSGDFLPEERKGPDIFYPAIKQKAVLSTRKREEEQQERRKRHQEADLFVKTKP